MNVLYILKTIYHKYHNNEMYLGITKNIDPCSLKKIIFGSFCTGIFYTGNVYKRGKVFHDMDVK